MIAKLKRGFVVPLTKYFAAVTFRLSYHLFMPRTTSPTGGASPLEGTVDYIAHNSGAVTQQVNWQGALMPDAKGVLTFDVHAHPICAADKQTTVIRNVAQAFPEGGDPIEAVSTFSAACLGYSARSIKVSDPIVILSDDTVWGDASSYSGDPLFAGGAYFMSGPEYQWGRRIHNCHDVTTTVKFYQQLITDGPISPTIETRDMGKITFGPDEEKSVKFTFAVVLDDTQVINHIRFMT